jgi:hypothetical protein
MWVLTDFCTVTVPYVLCVQLFLISPFCRQNICCVSQTCVLTSIKIQIRPLCIIWKLINGLMLTSAVISSICVITFNFTHSSYQ